MLALLLAAAAGAGDVDRQIQDHRDQLKELKHQAAVKRAKAEQFADKEKGVLARLNKAEQAIDATRTYIRRLEEREAILGDDLRRTSAQLDIARRDLAAKREALHRRVRHTYMYGRARSLEVVFSASSFPQLLQRAAFLGRVLQQDRRLVADVKGREAGVERTLEDLKAKRAEVARLQTEKEREKKKFEALRKRRSRDLESVRGKRNANELAAEELERAASQLQEVLNELERRRLAAMNRDDRVLARLDRNNFGRNRGLLPWPVAGAVIGEFGRHVHPKYHTVTLNNGIDIQAPEGSAVHCVGDGVVDMVRWMDGYGLSVIVNHGRGFYTIYAHLSAVHVAKDDLVTPGQVIGAVGDTGSLKGTCLHFELREGATARDPRRWFR